MAIDSENVGPWWRQPWPWFLMSLPATAVVAGLTTLWIAIHNADSLVSDDYYKQGLAIYKVMGRDAMAKALDLVAKLSVRDTRIDIDLSGKLAARPTLLTLHLFHPTREDMDVSLNLPLGPDGRYTATLPALPPGIRHLVLNPADRSWRLTGEWRSPFTGRLTMHP